MLRMGLRPELARKLGNGIGTRPPSTLVPMLAPIVQAVSKLRYAHYHASEMCDHNSAHTWANGKNTEFDAASQSR